MLAGWLARSFPILIVAILGAIGFQAADTRGQGIPRTSPCGSIAEAAPSAIPVDQTGMMLRGLKLVSYYPAQRAWNRMWSDWDPAAVDADFAKMGRTRTI